MKLKFLLRNWSSVSAAAAVLVGSSSRVSAGNQPSTVENPKVGDGDPYEPLILKPPSIKTVSEERFAAHRSHSSHSSHRSHASHASHYSGSGSYQTPTYLPPKPSYSPSPPAAYARPSVTASPQSSPSVSGNSTRIELENGTIIYGSVLVKSAAGITVTTSDGTTYKFARKQLSARTVSDLSLPAEERAAVEQPSSVAKTTDVDANQGKEAMAQQIAELQAENARLREKSRGLTPGTVPRAVSATVTYRIEGLPQNAPFLNIREGPGSNYPIVGSLPATTRGIIFGPKRVTNGWTIWQEVTGGGYSGWANAQYLVPEAPTH